MVSALSNLAQDLKVQSAWEEIRVSRVRQIWSFAHGQFWLTRSNHFVGEVQSAKLRRRISFFTYFCKINSFSFLCFQVRSMPAYPSYSDCLHTLVDLASFARCLHTPVTYSFPRFKKSQTREWAWYWGMRTYKQRDMPITLCPHPRTHIIYWRWCQFAHEIAQQRCAVSTSVFLHSLLQVVGHVSTRVGAAIRHILCFKRYRQFAPHDALHDSTDAYSQHINRPISSCNGPIPTILGLFHIDLIPPVQSVGSESSYHRFERRYRYLYVQFFILTRRTVTAAATTTSPHIPICEYFSTNLFANDSLDTYVSAVCNISWNELAEQDMRHTLGENIWKSDLLFIQQSTDTWKI